MPKLARYERPTLRVKKVLEESANWNAPQKLVQAL
jgi:hypothetical protein